MHVSRWISVLVLGSLLVVVGAVPPAQSEEKVIQTQKTKDVVITLQSEAGQWAHGEIAFVVEFASGEALTPVGAGKGVLGTSMAMPGMAPMISGAAVAPDRSAGRYLGPIQFPASGAPLVPVSWDGP